MIKKLVKYNAPLENTEKKYHINLVLGSEGYERIGKLRSKINVKSNAEVIRRALQVYEWLINEVIDNNGVCYVGEDGQESSKLQKVKMFTK